MVHVRHSVNVTTEGSGTAGADVDTAATGSFVTLNATPADGWRFKEWRVSSDSVTIENNRFTCDGKMVEADAVGRYQVARIRGIKATELGDDFKLSVYTDDSAGDVTYCPLTYCRNVLESGTQNTKLHDIVTALYWYWDKAGGYFEN